MHFALSLIFLFVSLHALIGRAAEPLTPAPSINLDGEWRFQLDKTNRGEREKWFDSTFDDAAWKPIRVPGTWEEQGYPNYNGLAWYRRTLRIGAEWKDKAVFLCLPAIDESDDTYFNGTRIGGLKNSFTVPRVYAIPAELIRFGEENSIAVRVSDQYGGGGMSRGSARLTTPSIFASVAAAAEQAPPEPLALGATVGIVDLLKKQGWKTGWRDEGTAANSRLTLHARAGAFEGKDALGIQIHQPNSSNEYVEYPLGKSEDGAVWRERKFDYLSFWCKAIETEGEMAISLNGGNFKWKKKGGPNWSASFRVSPGEWRKVVLPFSSFAERGTGAAERMDTTAGINTISLGYRNNELERPGEVQVAAFELGSFRHSPEARAIPLDGFWRFSPDADDRGAKQEWAGKGFDDSAWPWLLIGTTWESQGHPTLDGAAWYRQQVFIPEAWKDLPLRLQAGHAVDANDSAEAYFNGEPIGRTRKNAPNLDYPIPAALVKAGEVNTLAIRVEDAQAGGGLVEGPFSVAPESCAMAVRVAGAEGLGVPPEHFDMGLRPDRRFEVLFHIPEIVSGEAKDLKLEYELVECFHRVIKRGEVPLKSGVAPRQLSAVVVLDAEESRRLFYGEIISYSAILKAADGSYRGAFSRESIQLDYSARDKQPLADLPENIEETPYGKLKLVDVIDCAKDPAEDEHPYKEGGVRASWVGRRAYSTWLKGIDINGFQGARYREANNGEWFGYRVGRGKIKPHTPYLMRIQYPEDKTRYFVMNIDASRNYHGTGFKSGVSSDNPIDNYPLSGQYERFDHIVVPDDTTYGFQGSRTATGEHGFWVFFHDNGRCYTPEYQSGPGVAQIRLYEVSDLERHLPVIRKPANLPERVLMADWEREPEAPPADVIRKAKFLGFNMISPEVLKWSNMAYWRTKLDLKILKPVRDPLPDGETAAYDQYLEAAAAANMKILPRIEYGGFDSLPPAIRAIGDDGEPAKPNRFHTWCGDLLQPATWTEFSAVIDEVVGAYHQKYPQISGILWRIRSDRMPISYSAFDIQLFAKETGEKIPPTLKGAALSKWASSGGMKKKYEAWWHRKRLEFHVKVRDKLRSLRPDMKLYYYNWDPDGWKIGEMPRTPQDFADLYNVHASIKSYERALQHRAKYSPADYIKQLVNGGEPQHRPLTPLYKDTDGIAFFAPVHGRYLADNEPYITHFRTGDGLAVCNMFNYEEKSRWNVQGDNYETSEMTPGGPAFAVAEEVLAFFHGDPNIITCTTYTFGRGFANIHRRFAQAFLSLPAMPGAVVENAAAPADAAVKVRRYDTVNGTYLSVAHKGHAPGKWTFAIPGNWDAKTVVTDLVTGTPCECRIVDGKLLFEAASGAMELNSFLIAPKTP